MQEVNVSIGILQHRINYILFLISQYGFDNNQLSPEWEALSGMQRGETMLTVFPNPQCSPPLSLPRRVSDSLAAYWRSFGEYLQWEGEL